MHRSLHSTLVPNPTANAAAIDEAQTDLGDVLTLNETFKQALPPLPPLPPLVLPPLPTVAAIV